MLTGGSTPKLVTLSNSELGDHYFWHHGKFAMPTSSDRGAEG